ncbi:MAG: hypothetical protein WBN75_06395 [Verrucomicrobiia bacterium]
MQNKRIASLATVAALAAMVLTATIPAGAQFINGTFIKGANLPWLDGDYNTWIGIDPTEPGWGCGYNSVHMNEYLADMHNMGITVVRIWINQGDMGCTIDANDNVTGVTALFWSNMDNCVQLAANNGIQLYVTLNNGREDWLSNPAQADAYKTNALIPMIQRYKGNSAIFAIDLMNEIDGCVQGSLGNYGTTGPTWAQAQAYITDFASAVHSADSNRLVSCSTGWHQWYNLSYFKGLGLDFYDFHNYQDAPVFPTAASLSMDKPIYIGECGQANTNWNDSIQSNCELDALYSARNGNFAGVGIWAYQYPGCSDYHTMVNTNGSWRTVCHTIQNWNYGPVNTLLNLQNSGGNMVLTWQSGTLLESTNLTGPWVTNNAASPYTFAPTAAQKFYQLKILANPISINFSGNGTQMGGSESAGVVAETNWNNAAGSSGTMSLNDFTGTPCGASLTWSANGVYNTGVSDTAGNNRMMRNYLDTGNTTTTTVTVGWLPPNTAGWNVYVYFDGSNPETRKGSYIISGVGIPTTSIYGIDTANTDFSGTFVQASNSAGNYVRYSIPNVSGFTVSATPVANGASTLRAPVNGLQIIPK